MFSDTNYPRGQVDLCWKSTLSPYGSLFRFFRVERALRLRPDRRVNGDNERQSQCGLEHRVAFHPSFSVLMCRAHGRGARGAPHGQFPLVRD
jgi:hypothetical protein